MKHIPRRYKELSSVLALMLITTPIFWLTELDIKVSQYFFMANNGHWLGEQWQWAQFLFHYLPRIINISALLALLLALASYIKGNKKLTVIRYPAFYFVLLLLLGPGLVVNLVFKDHWGRPRPVHIDAFGCKYPYVAPLKLGHSEDKSFSCGHCAAAFNLLAAYFLARRYKGLYLILALTAGLIMSLARIAVGGHFLSDALWSAYSVFLVGWVLYYYWYIKIPTLNRCYLTD